VSTLTDRLRGIIGPPAPGHPSSGDRATASQPIDDALGGEWRAGECGACFIVETRIGPDTPHGWTTVGSIGEQLTSAAHYAPMVAGGSPARPPFIFFDLETTGLNGGAGTYAFLVGCGEFDGAAFAIRQFVLTRFADERPLLEGVRRALGEAGALVSFNGKSFDAPLLETRYLFHRLQGIQGARPHLDMLHSARRFWGGARSTLEPACSLTALEREILGVTRPHDVAGFEIPARYFQFVRSGDARPLAAVLEHNRGDLLSLAALTSRILSLVRAGSDAAHDPREALALGLVYSQAGLDTRAVDAYRRATAMIDENSCGSGIDAGALRLAALRALALLSRRMRRHGDAARYWQQILEVDRCPAHVWREATEALAIHHEHRVRDLETAKAFALRSLDVGTGSARAAAARHRLERLDRKLRVSEPRLAWLS